MPVFEDFEGSTSAKIENIPRTFEMHNNLPENMETEYDTLRYFQPEKTEPRQFEIQKTLPRHFETQKRPPRHFGDQHLSSVKWHEGEFHNPKYETQEYNPRFADQKPISDDPFDDEINRETARHQLYKRRAWHPTFRNVVHKHERAFIERRNERAFVESSWSYPDTSRHKSNRSDLQNVIAFNKYNYNANAIDTKKQQRTNKFNYNTNAFDNNNINNNNNNNKQQQQHTRKPNSRKHSRIKVTNLLNFENKSTTSSDSGMRITLDEDPPSKKNKAYKEGEYIIYITRYPKKMNIFMYIKQGI